MSHPVSGIDHCYLLVRDLDRSRDQFRRMGFTLSPRGLHSARKGTANRTIMLSDNDYFELLGIVAETQENAPRRKLLERDGEGLQAIACRIDDANDAKARLAALGIPTGAVQRFDRPVPLPDGSEGIAAFSTLQFEPKDVPAGTVFMCQHHTRETVWLPELMTHRNGARALAGILASHADPKGAAEACARLFAAGSVTPVPGGWQVETGSIPVTFLTAGELASRYAGLDVRQTPKGGFAVLQIAVADQATVRQILESEAIEAHPTSRGIAVDPVMASGAVVEFVSA